MTSFTSRSWFSSCSSWYFML